jgi:hypothetical protein
VNFKVVETANNNVIYTFSPLTATPAPKIEPDIVEPGSANALTATITLTAEMKTAGQYSATGVFTINGKATTVGPLVVTAQ